MNILKKWYLWYWVLVAVISLLGYSQGWFYVDSAHPRTISGDDLTILFVIIFTIPLFSLISLILNIKKNIKLKKKYYKDWKFWVFAVILLFYLLTPLIMTFINYLNSPLRDLGFSFFEYLDNQVFI